jgi:hypothetical protein
MKIDDANEALDKIVEESMDTVFCEAKLYSYGKPVSIRLEGEFSPDDVLRIAIIAKHIEC